MTGCPFPRSARLIFCISLIFPVAVAAGKPESGLASDIAKHLHEGAATQRYTACLFLAELPAETSTLNNLRNAYSDAETKVDSICTAYALAKLTQESDATRRFIRVYPEGEAIQAFGGIHRDSGYPFGMAPPPQRYLAELARVDDDALYKLISALRFPDSAHGQSLLDTVTELYLQIPERVTKTADELGINLDRVRRAASSVETGDE